MELKIARWIREVSREKHDARASVRLIRASGLQLIVVIFGTLGFYTLTDGQYSLLKCTYMTVITLTTVGFGEIIPINSVCTSNLSFIVNSLFRIRDLSSLILLSSLGNI